MDTYRLTAIIDGYDVEGVGETWDEMLAAFALDCRKAADGYRMTIDSLVAAAERCERTAKDNDGR